MRLGRHRDTDRWTYLDDSDPKTWGPYEAQAAWPFPEWDRPAPKPVGNQWAEPPKKRGLFALVAARVATIWAHFTMETGRSED